MFIAPLLPGLGTLHLSSLPPAFLVDTRPSLGVKWIAPATLARPGIGASQYV